MIRLEIELSSKCNLKCPLCIRQTQPELINSDELEYSELISVLDKHQDLKYVTIAGPRSEPTLYPLLFDLLKYLNSRSLEISLYINGDTHKDIYYRKLGLLFSKMNGVIYFTVAGTTQELHSKYRVGSNLENVLYRYSLIELYSKKAMLNYIVFNYNQEDSKLIDMVFQGYKKEIFFTLPVTEHYLLESDIKLPYEQSKAYSTLDRTDKEIICPSKTNDFQLLSANGEFSLCSLYAMYGDKHCWECSTKNRKILNDNKIYRLSESEDTLSEKLLHLKGI